MENRELIRRFVAFEEDIDNSIPLNEDGCLDVKTINKLPLDSRVKMVSKLNEKQFINYLSYTSRNEDVKRPVRAVRVDYTMEEDIARGNGVEAFGFLESMRKKYL